MGMNHHQNAYACTIKACNIQSTEYDHHIIPHNANTNISHDNNSIIMDNRYSIIMKQLSQSINMPNAYPLISKTVTDIYNNNNNNS